MQTILTTSSSIIIGKQFTLFADLQQNFHENYVPTIYSESADIEIMVSMTPTYSALNQCMVMITL